MRFSLMRLVWTSMKRMAVMDDVKVHVIENELMSVR